MVYLEQAGKLFGYQFEKYHDWNDAVQLTNGHGVFTCKESELITAIQYEEMARKELGEEFSKVNAALLKEWGTGPAKDSKAAHRRHVSAIAKKLNRNPSGIGRTIAAAQRYGLLKGANEPEASGVDSGKSSGS